MMKLGLFAGTLILALAFGGCSPTSPQAQGNTPKAEKEFKVALLTPGSVNDAGWSAMAYDGLKAIESELGAKINNEEATGPKIKESFRSYAQDGVQLIFGHGFEYNEPASEVAKDFPDTVFVSSSGGIIGENVGAFRFYLEQGFYLAGMSAAAMSKSGTIGTISLSGIPSIDSTMKAYEAGAKSVNDQIKIIKVSVNSGSDTAEAKRATLEAINQGADFVIHQVNAAAQGVFDACAERHVYAFGANLNQNDNSSGAVIASAIIVAKPAFVDLAKRVKEGSYKGSVELYGMQKGAIDFVWNPALEEKVPEDVKKKIEGAMAAINDGQLVVPKDDF